ncbi:MAG: T9SS type A sorting domain-containing protein [Rhodothermales bacterium]
MSNIFPKVLSFTLGVMFFVSNSVYAQVPVALPIEYYEARDISLPLTVGDVTGQDVKAFLLTMTYDDSIIEITGVEALGDLAEDFALILNMDTPGQISIGGAHYEPLQGDGILMHITGKFRKKGTTNLSLDSFSFNEGSPRAATKNGEISNTVQVSNEDEGLVPTSFELLGNYPNPFNPTTTIQFDLPETAEVTIKLVDMLGREALTIPSRVYQAGAQHRIDVDASSLASGVYVYQVRALGATNTYVKSATMTLLK